MNTSLMPVPRLQFLDATGAPLAGGQVWTYAAGTTTPQATYQDSLGAAPNTNPVLLDAGGFAAIWLQQLTYKIVVQDVNGVQQWTADNVSSISQAQLAALNSFASLNVTGNATVGGNLEVDGTLSAPSIALTGTAVIGGALEAASAAFSGNAAITGDLTANTAEIASNETVGGTLTVTGATSLSTLKVGGTDINALITSLIPAITAVSGALIITNVSATGSWVVFTFGATAGTRIRIAIGSGSHAPNGFTIPLPDSGFSTGQLLAHPSIDQNATTPGNQLDQWACSITAGVVSVSSSDNSGHNFAPTVAWMACAWQTGY